MKFGRTTTAVILVVGVVLPILEILLFLKVGSWIGVLPTIGLVLLSFVAGGFLLRHEGIRSWREVTGALNRGVAPTNELASGFLVMVGAALLAIPGFISDVFGVLLLIPPLRRALVSAASRRVGTGPVVMRRSDVIPGRVVDEPAPEQQPHSPDTDPPALQGRIID